MMRTALARLAMVLTLGAAASAAPARLGAQEEDLQTRTYRERREQLLRELQGSQQRVQQVREQRLQLSSRIESAIAQQLRQRAEQLTFAREATALQQLDALLTSSQDNLIAQRDRFLAIGEGARRRTGAMLVVLLRADSSGAQQLSAATLSVDGAAAEPRSYSAEANRALAVGAVDQLYRASVLPAAHTVTMQATVNGQSVSANAAVQAAPESVTYVQFAVRNGQVTTTTWSSRGTTPF